MIFRIYPDKDTFITSYRKNGTPQTGSNFGASEILEVSKLVHSSGNVGVSRILMSFPQDVINYVYSTYVTSSVSHSVCLRLKNVVHADTLPSSFDLCALPLSRSWDEGRGLDNDSFTDKGFANWDLAKSDISWSLSGGDFVEPECKQHFDYGDEDFFSSGTITSIVDSWQTGSLDNNGFIIKLTSSQEVNDQDYFVKKFYSRSTHVPERKPYLEVRWNSVTMTGNMPLDPNGPYVVKITNLKSEYEQDEIVRLRLHVRDVAYNPTVVTTGSSANRGYALNKAYYKIINDRTKETVVQFGSGTFDHTRLSYDNSGSFFDFHMQNLSTRNLYRVVLLLDISGSKTIIDENFKFRII